MWRAGKVKVPLTPRRCWVEALGGSCAQETSWAWDTGAYRTLWVGAPPTHDWGKKMPLVQKPGVDWGQHPEDAIPAK